jgi:hypothetical protein
MLHTGPLPGILRALVEPDVARVGVVAFETKSQKPEGSVNNIFTGSTKGRFGKHTAIVVIGGIGVRGPDAKEVLAAVLLIGHVHLLAANAVDRGRILKVVRCDDKAAWDNSKELRKHQNTWK